MQRLHGSGSIARWALELDSSDTRLYHSPAWTGLYLSKLQILLTKCKRARAIHTNRDTVPGVH